MSTKSVEDFGVRIIPPRYVLTFAAGVGVGLGVGILTAQASERKAEAQLAGKVRDVGNSNRPQATPQHGQPTRAMYWALPGYSFDVSYPATVCIAGGSRGRTFEGPSLKKGEPPRPPARHPPAVGKGLLIFFIRRCPPMRWLSEPVLPFPRFLSTLLAASRIITSNPSHARASAIDSRFCERSALIADLPSEQIPFRPGTQMIKRTMARCSRSSPILETSEFRSFRS